MVATDELVPAELAGRLERLTLVTRSPLVGSGQGDRRSRRRGSSLEFLDHRPYSPGDDPSRLDWNVYGRSGQLHVKVFESEELLGVKLLLDGSASMSWGEPDKFGRARQITAALGYLALAGGNRVQVSMLRSRGAVSSRPFWGRWRAPELFESVAALAPDGSGQEPAENSGNLEHLVRQSRASGAAGGNRRRVQMVVLLSDLLSPTWQGALRSLAGVGSELVVLHVLDRSEIEPELGGDLNLVDQETGARVPVTLNAEAVSWYRNRAQAWLGEVTEFCARLGARYARHVTSTPLDTWLFRDLRRRRVLR